MAKVQRLKAKLKSGIGFENGILLLTNCVASILDFKFIIFPFSF